MIKYSSQQPLIKQLLELVNKLWVITYPRYNSATLYFFFHGFKLNENGNLLSCQRNKIIISSNSWKSRRGNVNIFKLRHLYHYVNHENYNCNINTCSTNTDFNRKIWCIVVPCVLLLK